jgi:hypothetical protein
MTTSAQALNQLLAVASSHKPIEDKFLPVLANHLQLDRENSELEVVALIQRLIKQIEKDIATAEFAEDENLHVTRFLVPFNNILAFNHLNMTIKQARDHHLKPDHLVGLTNLHLALSARVDYSDLNKDIKEYADELRNIRGQIIELDIPERARRVISDRLNQISSMLDNFYAFGPDALQSEIEALVGVLVLNPVTEVASKKPAYGAMIAALLVVLTGLKGVDTALGATLSASKKGMALLELYSGDESDD